MRSNTGDLLAAKIKAQHLKIMFDSTIIAIYVDHNWFFRANASKKCHSDLEDQKIPERKKQTKTDLIDPRVMVIAYGRSRTGQYKSTPLKRTHL